MRLHARCTDRYSFACAVQVARHVTTSWYCHLLHDDATLSHISILTYFRFILAVSDGRMRHILILPSISSFAKLVVRSHEHITSVLCGQSCQYLRETLNMD